MKHLYEILNSKISAPVITTAIKRKRFNSVFASFLENKITIVTAGAGYGKTTLIAQACEYIVCDKSWYRLESNDADPLIFIHYIIAGIKKTYPDFGERTLNRLKAAVEIDQTLLSVLINEIEMTLSNDFLIVLDDCHKVADSTEINTIIRFFIDHLPENVCIVMASRIEPSLSLSKYRARMEINEVRQRDLIFTIDETVELYGHLFGFSIPGQSVENLHKWSEGWASGLILFYHLSKGKKIDEIEDLLLEIKNRHKIFREYMRETVYENQSQEVKDFLLYSSIFNRIDPEVCNRFLNIENSGTILEQLEKKHLFTTSFGNGKIYSYHNILKEFLTFKLEQEKGRLSLYESHYCSAGIFEETGNGEEALYHYLQAEKYDDVFRILQTIGHQLFNQGKREVLDDFLKKIPEDIVQNEPWPLALKAKLYLSQGQFCKAVAYSKKAHEIFIERKMKEGAGTALMVLGRSYCFIGNFFKAEKTFLKVLNSGFADEYTCLEIMSNLIFTSAFAGDFKSSDNYYQEAVLRLEKLNKTEGYQVVKIWINLNYGFRWYFFGDFSKSCFYADTVSEDIKTLNFSSAKAFYLQLRTLNYLFSGDIKEAYKHTSKGLKEIAGKDFYGAREAWLNMNAGVISLIDGNYEAAKLKIENNIKRFKSGGSKWGEATMVLLLIWANEKTGQMEKAGQWVLEGLRIVNELELPRVRGKLYLFAAYDMMLKKEYQQADLYFKRSEEILSFSLFERCIFLNMRAKFYSDQGFEDQALDLLSQAIEIGEKYLYGSWIFFGIENELSLFVKIYASGKFKNYLVNFFSDYWEYFSKGLYLLEKSNNVNIKNAVSEIIMQMPEEPIPPLSVCCLGKFRVFVGNREVKNSEWKSKKARDIFKYLVLSRDKGAVSKDVLIELIWPEQDYEKTLKRLHVALPALRKALEPDLKKGESAYLLRENDHYRIDFGNGGFVDVDLFIKEIEFAEKEKSVKKRLGHLLKAESCYAGDFLEEDLYVDWYIEQRELLKRQYINVLGSILAIYESLKDSENSIKYAEKYLEVDSYSEDKYQKLMKYFLESGNYSMGIKTYEKCYAKIVEDLDCPLNEETIILYEKLTKTNKNIRISYK